MAAKTNRERTENDDENLNLDSMVGESEHSHQTTEGEKDKV